MELSHSQIRSFLDEAGALTSSVAEPSAVDVVVAERAEITRELVRRHFGLEISMDEAGLRNLDQLLTAMHNAMQPGQPEPGSLAAADYVAVCESLGALFGEIVRTHIRGRWDVAEFKGQRCLALLTPMGGKLAVMEKAGKQYLNGKGDSVSFMFGIARKVSEAAERVASLPPEERVALRQRALKQVEERKAAAREKLNLDKREGN